jgi:serine/threonine protein kinase
VSVTGIRDKLARISMRPAAEWQRRVDEEFPGDPAMRMQALLWLHADHEGPDLEGAPPSLGEAADERYELGVRLGDIGATASVWHAVDRRLGRNVAIKVFHERSESEALDQVLAEARAASDVISEHVVRVLDVQYGDGRPYIVMELISEYDPDKGEVVLGATAAATEPRDIDEVVRWVMHVARGVHEAHLRNVFHRDIKPRNVLITPNSRRARIADFGLAVSSASADLAHPSITLLKRGPSGPVSVRGTPEFMAPEQARGLPLTLDARALDDRAVLVAIDVWGLGALAYRLLTGTSPWPTRRADGLTPWEIAASSEQPAPLERTRDGDKVPRRLRRVIDKAMSSDPKARYASAAAIANELQAYLARKPTTLDRSRALRLGLWCRRNPQLALTALVAVGLTAVAAGTHLTVARLRDERAVLAREVAAQEIEREQLDASINETRRKLTTTQAALETDRATLAGLEKALAEERASYQALIEAKEQALRDANAATRRIVEELAATQRDRRAAEQARLNAENLIEAARKDADKLTKERDRMRRERETARTERDAAITERDAVERTLRELKATLESVSKPRTPEP